MPNILFVANLLQGLSPFDRRIVEGSDHPFQDLYDQENAEQTEQDTADLYNLMQVFAEGLCPDTPLCDQIEQFSEAIGADWDSDDCDLFGAVLVETTQRAGFSGDDKSIRKFLSMFHGVPSRPGVTNTTATVSGPTPTGTAAFLKQLKVQQHHDFAWNDDAFQAKNVKVFDRSPHYGHPPSASDFNQKPTQGPVLTNPILNVHQEAYGVVDAVGLGMNHQHKVVNLLSNEYASDYMNKEDAENLAATMNQKYVQDLDESGVTRKHFREVANTVRQIEDPQTRQALVDHHASIFAKANPRFDHSRFHEACGTLHRKGHNEARNLPQTDLQESLMKPLTATNTERYLAAINKQNWTMGGSFADSDYSASQSPASTFKQTARLKANAANKFSNGADVSEQNAVRSRQAKSNPRPNQVLLQDAGSDKNFLNEINSGSGARYSGSYTPEKWKEI